MNRPIFIDSNVLIDIATRRRNCEDLEKLMVLIRLGEVDTFISSSQIITSNKKDFSTYDIKCGDASDFFAWLKKEKGMDYSFIGL